MNASRISKRCQALSESILPELPDPEEFLWQLRKMDSLESFFKNYIEEAKKTPYKKTWKMNLGALMATS